MRAAIVRQRCNNCRDHDPAAAAFRCGRVNASGRGVSDGLMHLCNQHAMFADFVPSDTKQLTARWLTSTGATGRRSRTPLTVRRRTDPMATPSRP
jgi:hypothetical protein